MQARLAGEQAQASRARNRTNVVISVWICVVTVCVFKDKLYPHIEPKYLLQVCARIGPILEEKFPPPIRGIASLLGAGRHSLLRRSSTSGRVLNIPYYASRKHGMPLTDQITYTVHNIGKCLSPDPCLGSLVNQLIINSLKNRASAKATTLLTSKGIILTDQIAWKPLI